VASTRASQRRPLPSGFKNSARSTSRPTAETSPIPTTRHRRARLAKKKNGGDREARELNRADVFLFRERPANDERRTIEKLLFEKSTPAPA
jgi:hypothetical protein